ncbi:MAG: hypothetical protein HYV60_21465 [Planctomycetia bacterium]|nr:hypothetical protein [Planctomycetia bacterium]
MPAQVVSVRTAAIALIALACLANPAFAETQSEPPEGFVAFFNDTDLSGWKGLVADPPKRAKMSEGEPTVAARQPIPNREGSVVQPATAEADVPDGRDVTEAVDDLIAVDEESVPAATNKPERGEFVIDNPSALEFKLLTNGALQHIKARGVTTFDVSVGTIKTQIATD